MDDEIGAAAEGLELATMIEGLRQELMRAHELADEGDLTFAIAGIEVEATVQVARTTDGRGGVKFYVIEAGGGVGRANTSTQRIKLSLRPTRDDYEVGDDQGRPR